MTFFKAVKTKDNERVVRLGEITPLRFVQYQQWHELFLTGPTSSVIGVQGNDFPGAYYYDPRDQEEHVFIVIGEVDWNKSRLVRRISEDGDKTFLEIALVSSEKLKWEVKLKHWHMPRSIGVINADSRDAMPSQWEALETLISKSYELLCLPTSKDSHDWQRTAKLCLGSLNEIKDRKTIHDSEMCVFFQTFRSNRSSYGRELVPETTYPGTSELICQVGLTSSLLAYEKTNPACGKACKKLALELLKTLPLFFDNETSFFQNTFPPRGEEWERRVIDTWYAFHNLYHILRVASLAECDMLKGYSEVALSRIIKFVRACNYHIPLFARIAKTTDKNQADDGQIIGFAINPSVLGMYAQCLVLGSKLFSNRSRSFKKEAVKSLKLLRRYPIKQLHHQTVQLSWAASAAHELDKIAWRDDFARCLLLQCYRNKAHGGLFQGCAGLGYPAFRETVEAIEGWADWYQESPDILQLDKIMRLVLCKADWFIEKKNRTFGLPNEGLATTEQPEASEIGIAIYAAPQVFELARIERIIQINGG